MSIRDDIQRDQDNLADLGWREIRRTYSHLRPIVSIVGRTAELECGHAIHVERFHCVGHQMNCEVCKEMDQ